MLLALAINAAERLKDTQGAVSKVNNRPLVVPSLERAFRETLYIRGRLPDVAFTARNTWPVALTRWGQLEEKDED